MFDKEVNLWTLQEWAWILLPSLLGGSLTWYQKQHNRKLVFKISELLGEWFIAGFAGFAVSLPLIYFKFDTKLIVVASAITGHFAARAILFMEYMAEVKAAKLADIDRVDFEKKFLKSSFENSSDLMSFGEAHIKCMEGKVISRLIWNSEEWVSLTGGESGIEVKRDDFWSLNNSQYAATKETKSVIVLPYLTKKTKDGKIEVGWFPSQADMASRDWKVISID
jgi:hypothetical protein